MSKSSKKNPQRFVPPTAQQVRSHLDRHPPRRPTRVFLWLTLAMVGALLLSLRTTQVWMWLLPWVLVLASVILMTARVRRARWLEQQALRAQELAMQRRWRGSLRLAWRLLPYATPFPALHGRLVALTAHNLDAMRAFESALLAYDYLIERLPPSLPIALQLRVNRAVLLLETDQLSDADDALRSLRGAVEDFAHSAIAAAYHLAQLMQLVRTNHFADAVDLSGQLLDNLRPLGVDAAYGHALMALCYHRVEDQPENPPSPNAALWWARANLLMPANDLIGRFPELQRIGQDDRYRTIALEQRMPETA